jgi:hypothetical protein
MHTVSKQRKVLVAFISVLAVVGLASVRFRASEPRCRDIPLSEWLALLRSYELREVSKYILLDAAREVPGRDKLGPQAADAIRQIGTNALPSLIAWMNVRQSPWKLTLAATLRKLPSPVRPNKLPGWLDYAKDCDRASLAYTGFRALGPAAAPAIPDVAQIACDSRRLGSGNAVHVLVQIGKPAVPELARLLSTNVANPTRKDIMFGLGFLGSNAAESVPAIAACLELSDEAMACVAASTLARIKRRSEIAIPALIKSLEDRRYEVRLAAVRALGDYGSDALPATAVLQSLCVQPDVQLGWEAKHALLKIGSAASDEPFRTGFDPAIELQGIR